MLGGRFRKAEEFEVGRDLLKQHIYPDLEIAAVWPERPQYGRQLSFPPVGYRRSGQCNEAACNATAHETNHGKRKRSLKADQQEDEFIVIHSLLLT